VVISVIWPLIELSVFLKKYAKRVAVERSQTQRSWQHISCAESTVGRVIETQEKEIDGNAVIRARQAVRRPGYDPETIMVRPTRVIVDLDLSKKYIAAL
jgi:hypothetical protein